MGDRAGDGGEPTAGPLLETVWTNWPAVILFGAGIAAAAYWSVQPGTVWAFPFGFPWVLAIEAVWIALALQNARLMLTIYPNRIVMRALIGRPRELGRAHWNCLQVVDPVAITWWQRWWSGSGTRSMLVAERGSPCRSLFVPAALTGVPLPRDDRDRVSDLLAQGPPSAS